MTLRLRSPIVRVRADELGPRFTIAVTHHAVEQARERYDEQVEPIGIVEDVAAAMSAGRSDRRPGTSSLFVWTPERERMYVVRKHKRGWLIVTALHTRKPQSLVDVLFEQARALISEQIAELKVRA